MSILNFQLNNIGQSGVHPTLAYFFTNDSVDTVTSLGYLDKLINNNNLPLQVADMALVTTRETLTSPTLVEWYEVSRSNQHWLLIPAGSNSGAISRWVNVTATSANAQTNVGYVTESSSLTTIQLPAVAPFGSLIAVVGNGSGLWRVQAASGQTIRVGSLATASSGYVTSSASHDTAEFLCTTSNSIWTCRNTLTSNLTLT